MSDIRDITPKESQERIIEELKKIYDPEIPVDIYNLGLIYDVTCNKDEVSKLNKCKITMTLTAPTCSMSQIIVDMVKNIAHVIEDGSVEDIEVDVVFDPPWDQSKMSDEAKLTMGML
jgi:metal-sulfur cluster biosynthetic enzyme